jgi:hypothetical protein
MFLVLSIVALAGLFVLLHAFFPGGGADPGLCGRGHGAVPVRDHAAGRERGGTAR